VSKLADHYFHEFEGDEIRRQGCVISWETDDVLLVEWLSWLDGEPTYRELVLLERAMEWRFYASAADADGVYKEHVKTRTHLGKQEPLP